METADKYCCRTLPMRNWYGIHIIHSIHSKVFISRTLPMRNWYLSIVQFQVTHNLDFQVGHYLWGIDTSSQPLTIALPHVGHYLWGIDTNKKLIIIEILNSKTFSVGHYLWGIDTCSLWKTSTCDLSQSDITYEELIQTADWRIVFRQFVGHYLWGIDTISVTSLKILPETFFVRRTLPMRNWYLLPASMIPAVAVGHYLWGIDTWRITFRGFVSKLSMRMSDITYEELIQEGKIGWLHLQVCRTLPMRNWYYLLIPLHTQP